MGQDGTRMPTRGRRVVPGWPQRDPSPRGWPKKVLKANEMRPRFLIVKHVAKRWYFKTSKTNIKKRNGLTCSRASGEGYDGVKMAPRWVQEGGKMSENGDERLQRGKIDGKTAP